MTDYPSQASTPELGAAFPTRIPDPETMVYTYVKAAAAGTLPSGAPALQFYADQARALSEGKIIDVAQGWPAYTGVMPAIGIGSGNEGEDPAQATIQGGFVGELLAYQPDGVTVLGAADYYSEPLYIPVVVVLIHENRDERDRLHHQLRMVLTPLRTYLPLIDAQIKRVTVDMQKDEMSSDGPPVSELPFLVYTSITTVHVYCEMLSPRNIVDAAHRLTAIQVATSTPVSFVKSLPVDSV
jgi:hypothetical protein